LSRVETAGLRHPIQKSRSEAGVLCDQVVRSIVTLADAEQIEPQHATGLANELSSADFVTFKSPARDTAHAAVAGTRAIARHLFISATDILDSAAWDDSDCGMRRILS
jgi:G3E family GTPase